MGKAGRPIVLRTVHFHGALKRKFKRSSIKLDASNVAEAMRGLSLMLPGFNEYVRDRQYVVTAANDHDELPLDEDALLLNLGQRRHIHVIPAAQAAGIETFLIVGLVLVAAAAVATVLFMRPKAPDVQSRERKDQSFIYNGAVNSAEQGHPVALIYGFNVRVGSILVSGGISTTDIGTSTYSPPNEGGGYVGSTPGVNTPSGTSFRDVARPILVEAVANKGGKAGGAGSSRSAEESPNTLRSQATVRLVDLLGEGEIGGLVNGLKSVFLDDTPVQNNDGSFNFSGFSLEQRVGLPDQDPMPGFPFQETGVDVGSDVTTNSAVVRTISDPVVDVARVTIGIPALFEQNTTNGDLGPSSVQLAIDYQSNGGGYTQVVLDTIQGKTNSPYQRSYDVRLTGEAPHNVRVRRVTPDATLASLKNETRWETLFEIVEAKLSYPDSALIGITVDAKQFGANVPNRSYEVNGLYVDVPSNYDPITRTYTGIWNGTFKRAITNNPAWIFYNIVKHKRYGLGKRVPLDSIDKYGLYAVAQYCDGLIPNGRGGEQPRYTINGVINSEVSAYNLLSSIASAFRGFVYWGSNSVMVAQDRPEDPSMLVTPANVVDGRISYQTNIEKQKLRSVAIVYWNNPEDNFRLVPEIVEDPNLIRRIGWEPGPAVARFGCTNRAEAHYAAKWILEDQENGNKSVKYDAIDDHGFVRPGTVIAVADPKFTAGRRGGRVKAADANSVTVDFGITLVGGQIYFLRVMLPDGTVARRQVTNGPGTHTTLTLAGAAFAAPPRVASVWALDSNTVVNRQFRIRSISTDEPPLSVTGTLFDPNSFARVEQGIDLPPDNFLEVLDGPLEVPKDLAVIEYLLADGTSSVPAVQFSWASATDPRISYFQARFQRPGGQWEPTEDSAALSRIVRNSEPGVWSFMVRGVDALGHKTAWAHGSAELDGQADVLPEVVSPGITVDSAMQAATLIWDAPIGYRPFRYEIMFSAGGPYNTAVSLGTTDALAWPVTLVGNYWVRTTFLGLVSPAPVMVTATALVVSGSIVPYLTNETMALPADSDGNVTSYQGAEGIFKVLAGGVDVTNQFYLSPTPVADPQALTEQLDGMTYKVVGGFDANEPTASLRLRANGGGPYTGVQLDKVFSLSKAIGGSDGEPGDDGLPGTSGDYKDIKFKRSYERPPTPTGADPVGWSDGLPAGAEGLWMSTARKNFAGALLGVWTLPQQITGLVNRGPYNSQTFYYLSNTVTLNGSTYVAIQDNFSGHAPSGTGQPNSYWDVLAAQGAPGQDAVPPSGFVATLNLTNTNGSVNLRSVADGAGYTGQSAATVTFVVPAGVTVQGLAGTPNGGVAIDTGSWPHTAYPIALTLQIEGTVRGGGGTGAPASTDVGQNGGTGGDAIYQRVNISGGIQIKPGGVLQAGGGGGGSGGGYLAQDNYGTQFEPEYHFTYYHSPGAGGGFPNGGGGGAGQAGGGPYPQDTTEYRASPAGAPGTLSGGGAPGEFNGISTSGAGGGSGISGSGGGNSGGAFPRGGGGGGAPGAAIRRNSFGGVVTNQGTVTGVEA